VLTGEHTIFPPLLGTGGNDGRLDFSTNFHQRLLDVIAVSDTEHARSLAIARDLIDGTENEQLASAHPGAA
jgi:CRISPR-associated protein Csx17